MTFATARESELGLLAALRDNRQFCLNRVTCGARLRRRLFRNGEVLNADPQLLASERPARLQRLALEPLVELRCLSLALEGPQP